MKLRDVRRVIEELEALRAEIEGASPSGLQLERAALETPGSCRQKPDEFRQAIASEIRYGRLAILTKMMAALEAKERVAIRFLCYPDGSETYCRMVTAGELQDANLPLEEWHPERRQLCNAQRADGTPCSNPRKPGELRCHIKAHYEQQRPAKTKLTRFGEELMGSVGSVEDYLDFAFGREAADAAVPDRQEYERVVTHRTAPVRLRDDEAIDRFIAHRLAIWPQEFRRQYWVEGQRRTYPHPRVAAMRFNQWMFEAAQVARLQHGLEFPVVPVTARGIVKIVEDAGEKWSRGTLREIIRGIQNDEEMPA